MSNNCGESEAQVSGVELQEACNQYLCLMRDRNKDILPTSNKPTSYRIPMTTTTHLEEVPHTADNKQEATNNHKYKNHLNPHLQQRAHSTLQGKVPGPKVQFNDPPRSRENYLKIINLFYRPRVLLPSFLLFHTLM